MSTDKISIWEDKWAKGDTPWHQGEVNDKLLSNMDELLGCAGPNGEVEKRTVLVPLCGKSKDMIHLYNEGHTVVGCEGVEKGCVEFFAENNLHMTRSPLEGIDGSLFSTDDGRLRLYQCDFLLLTSDLVELKFDTVWDHQSLVYINPRDRKQYVRTVRSLLKEQFRYLLVTIEYEPFAHLGTPHSISYNAVKELFGSFSSIKYVAKLPASPPCKPEWFENVFAIQCGQEDRVQYWQARWATGQSQWHKEKPHEILVKYHEKISEGSSMRIFLPLCGKSHDLLWLYQQGHTVLGVEGVPFVVEQLFRENKLDYEKTSMPNIAGWRFKTKDGRLTVYACDIFNLSPEIVGPIDCVFDRGSLGAIAVHDRQPYMNLMRTLLGPEFRYLLETYEYEDTEFDGPPRNLPRDVVFNLFADFADVDILEENDDPTKAEKFNVEWMQKVTYFIRPNPQ